MDKPVIIKKDGKELSEDEQKKMGIRIYKQDSTDEEDFDECAKQLSSILGRMMTIVENDMMNTSIDSSGYNEPSFAQTTMSDNDDIIMDELTKIFLPVLITQQLQGDVSSEIHESCSMDNVLFERNIVQFDNKTRYEQLVKVCAILINRHRNSQEFQLYKKAHSIAKNMVIKMQQNDYGAATALAQKFLNKISTMGTSSVARNAAQELKSAM